MMFKALVYACVIGFPGNCFILEDIKGPYQTKEACKERALEMARQIHSYYPLYKPDRWKCIQLKQRDMQGKLAL